MSLGRLPRRFSRRRSGHGGKRRRKIGRAPSYIVRLFSARAISRERKKSLLEKGGGGTDVGIAPTEKGGEGEMVVLIQLVLIGGAQHVKRLKKERGGKGLRHREDQCFV